jgi:DNA-binding NtrC family response regulator
VIKIASSGKVGGGEGGACARVLVTEADASVVALVRALALRDELEVVTAGAAEAAALVDEGQVDLVVVGEAGLGLVRAAAGLEGGPATIVVGGAGSSEGGAVEALRAGAADYLTRPATVEQLGDAVERVRRRLRRTERVAARGPTAARLLHTSPGLAPVIEQLVRAAPSKATVLLEGESGTGKELLASLLHEESPRRKGPLVRVNCAALAEGVLESELFGHERGAFTGAVERRLGRFELANGGTILLDEVSEMSLACQAKLLRVLEEEEIERVGGGKTIKLDVRVVAATNRDLAKEVARGAFRRDLYFRLAVFPVRVPALRERPADLPRLVQHFVATYKDEAPSSVVRFSSAALDLLARHDWPGNVRELENLVRRVVVKSPGVVVGPDDLAGELRSERELTGRPSRSMAVVEKDEIERALAQTDGNRAQAARLLGISVRTLFNRLKRYRDEGAELSVDFEAARVTSIQALSA